MAQSDTPFRSGMIAVVGRPNVGKSTLTNAMVGQKVAIVSDKPQTTRNRIMGVKSGEGYQMVFIDTPGLHKPRTRLGQYMQGAAKEAMDGVDALIVMADASCVTERDLLIATGMAEKKSTHDIHRVIVLNKIDLVEKPALLGVIAKFSALGYDDIVPVSARTGDGMNELTEILLKRLKPGPRYFPDDMPTDQTERALCGEIIREKLLRCLRDEVPHGIGVEMMAIHEKPSGITEIQADIYCERDAHKAIIIGKNGAMLRRVGEMAREDIERMLDAHVFLKLFVRVRPDWRNSPLDLNALGYDEKQ